MIAFRGLDKLREASTILPPVKLATVNDDASDGCAVATNPFGGTVYNDIRTVIDGTSKVPTSTEGVVNL